MTTHSRAEKLLLASELAHMVFRLCGPFALLTVPCSNLRLQRDALHGVEM